MDNIMLQGRITHIGAIETLEGKSKKTGEEYKIVKREFVIEEIDGGDYPQSVCLSINDRKGKDGSMIELTKKLDDFSIGDKVEVGVNFKANQYEKNGIIRFINQLNAWTVKKINDNKLPSVEDLPFRLS